MEQILAVKNINKSFGSFQALQDVSLEVPKGKIFGLLGPNGAGKTTLIRILTQITAPDVGSIFYKGKPLRPEHIETFGYLPEERGLYRKMKVWEQALYLIRLKGLQKTEAELRLKEWFERMNMTSWAEKKTEELSKGMQQKLQFVITVAPEPDLLILDEPFSGFDPVNTEELKQEILRLKKNGTSIIFSTHNMDSVEELCDSIALINKGEKIIDGKVEEIRASFSKSLYQVRFKGSKVGFANALGHQFEIVELNEEQSISSARVKAHENAGGNALLRALTKQVEVVSFQEEIPRMHDIFIDLVSPIPEITVE